MIKIEGNYIMRKGQRVGRIDGYYIRAHDDVKLGYFEGNNIHGIDGSKIAYVSGTYVYTQDGKTKVPLDKVSEEIEGGILPEIEKCAIYILIGV